MSFKQLDVVVETFNKPEFTVDDILWGVYPAIMNAHQEQIEFHKEQFLSIIDRVKFTAFKDVSPNKAYEAYEIQVRLIRTVASMLIILDRFDKFIEKINNSDLTIGDNLYTNADVYKNGIHGLASSLRNNNLHFLKYKKNIPLDLIQLQINAGIGYASMYLPNKEVNTVADLYNIVYVPMFKDKTTFSDFLNSTDHFFQSSILLDIESAKLICSANSDDYRVRPGVIDNFRLESIDALLMISDWYDLTDIYISSEVWKNISEESLDEYLSKITSFSRSSIAPYLNSDALSDRIIKKYIDLLMSDTHFVRLAEARYSLKEMLNMLEECV